MAMYVIVRSEMRVWRRGHSTHDTLLSQNFPTHVTACDGTPMKGSVTAHPWPHRATFKTSRYDCLSCFAWPLLTRRRRDTKSKESGLSFVLSRTASRTTITAPRRSAISRLPFVDDSPAEQDSSFTTLRLMLKEANTIRTHLPVFCIRQGRSNSGGENIGF